ncbi:putative NADH dehydrogenase [ubiquinone] 1 beta subcomplex subunit 2, mitochondrial, partial [Trichinella pseudospiralis]
LICTSYFIYAMELLANSSKITKRYVGVLNCMLKRFYSDKDHWTVPSFKGMVNEGPREHPQFFKMSNELHPGFGEDYLYRGTFDGKTHLYDKLMTKYLISGFFWGYMFYRLFYDYMEILGEPEWPLPYLESLTDEELGIPDDDSMPPRMY